MTRNTRMYRLKPVINGKKTEIIYRDLTCLELSAINNIKNKATQSEMAAIYAITNLDPMIVPWPIKQQIGLDILTKSSECITDMEMKDITITEFRNNDITEDPFIPDILMILRHFPGQSITELLNLTHRDLIELVIICEKVSNSKIYGNGNPGKNTHLVNPKDLPDGGKSLQREIEKLNSRGPLR